MALLTKKLMALKWEWINISWKWEEVISSLNSEVLIQPSSRTSRNRKNLISFLGRLYTVAAWNGKGLHSLTYGSHKVSCSCLQIQYLGLVHWAVNPDPDFQSRFLASVVFTETKENICKKELQQSQMLWVLRHKQNSPDRVIRQEELI